MQFALRAEMRGRKRIAGKLYSNKDTISPFFTRQLCLGKIVSFHEGRYVERGGHKSRYSNITSFPFAH